MLHKEGVKSLRSGRKPWRIGVVYVCGQTEQTQHAHSAELGGRGIILVGVASRCTVP